MLEVALERALAPFNVSIHLEIGSEILAVFGPSGAGKSMLLKMIAGIEHPDSGLVRSGQRVLYQSATGVSLPARLRRVGYVPQQYGLFPHLTALENVAFPLRTGLRGPSSAARDTARQLLTSFGLAGHQDAYPRSLSGGQQQRVALARALASEPEILLLDEPFAALDTPIRVELRQELRELQQRVGIPALFVTHDLEEAAAVANRMAVIVDGQIRQVGTVREVIDRPADVDVASLVQARNIVPGTLRRGQHGDLVMTAIGPVPVKVCRIQDGALVHLVMRPEAIRIVGEDAVDREGRYRFGLKGRVVEHRDEGLRASCRVDVSGTILHVDVPYHLDERLDLRDGTLVRLAIATTDIHLIPDSAGPLPL